MKNLNKSSATDGSTVPQPAGHPCQNAVPEEKQQLATVQRPTAHLDADSTLTREIYPRAESIFANRLKSVAEIRDTCCVVLDTNVLLDPYTTGDKDLLAQCKKIYKDLVAKNRLIIPAHAAREFARNRAEKLKELHQRLQNKKQLPDFPDYRLGIYPLLSDLSEYKEVIKLEEVLSRARKDYDNNVALYRNAVEKLITVVQGWRWNDPVSEIYHEIFQSNTVAEATIADSDLKQDLERRKRYKIPPGYKDASKDENAEGDLLIWHTIKEIGITRKTHILFVSKDVKPDWWHRSSGQPLYPRYELVYEFMDHTKGLSFQIIKFSEFLKLYGAIPAVVEKVRKQEEEEGESRKRHRIPRVSHDKFLEALLTFDNVLRNTPEFLGWEQKGRQRYAIEHEGRTYPVKKIISMATGAPLRSFSGGVYYANRYVKKLGFRIILLQDDISSKNANI